ncbi:hypothetical protein IC575_022530 [Cucumis melo]
MNSLNLFTPTTAFLSCGTRLYEYRLTSIVGVSTYFRAERGLSLRIGLD